MSISYCTLPKDASEAGFPDFVAGEEERREILESLENPGIYTLVRTMALLEDNALVEGCIFVWEGKSID